MNVLFFGTPEFSVPTLKALIASQNIKVGCVITQPDRPQGRGQSLTESPIKKVALAHKIPVLQPENIRKEKATFIETTKQFGPFDVAVVIAFGQILPQAVLDLPTHGSINIHGSLLPRWRGAAPMQRAIMAGDKVTGVALMKMEAGLDTGPVFCEERITIAPEDTLEKLHDHMAEVGAKLLVKKLPEICSGQIKPVAQPAEGVTYAHKIENTECQIDWSRDASEINNKIRGLNPVPGAFTIAGGKRLKIFEAKVVSPMRTGNYSAGQIIVVDPTRLEIKCGKDALSLYTVQLEGKKKMPVAEFLKGFSLSANDILR